MDTDPDCAILSDKTKVCAEKIQTYNSSDFKFITHPDYNNSTGENDIALIILKNPAKLSKSVAPICLPFGEFEENFLPVTAQVIGFGMTEKYWKPFSSVLMKAAIKVIENENCSMTYKNITNRPITEKNFCAAEIIIKEGKNASIDTCKGKNWLKIHFFLFILGLFNITINLILGDSGSPAMGLVNYRYTQYGIVSWGANQRCGLTPKLPGVYVKVYSHLQWILDNSNSTVS